jgi:hypothetical protein
MTFYWEAVRRFGDFITTEQVTRQMSGRWRLQRPSGKSGSLPTTERCNVGLTSEMISDPVHLLRVQLSRRTFQELLSFQSADIWTVIRLMAT